MPRTPVLSALLIVGVLTAAAPAGADQLQFSAAQNPATQPFYRWIPSAGVCNATFDLYGAEGFSPNAAAAAGGGAHLTTTLPVVPGRAYDVYVGKAGKYANGGYNGGGAAHGSGYGGGGATDVRTGPSLTERILVAGGGGGDGASADASSGRGGAAGLIGANGQDGGTYYHGRGGGGASTTGGGSAGRGGPPVGEPSPYWGSAGALGVGGAGGPSSGSGGQGYEGGGGGGGYFGGGGGGAGVGGISPVGGGGGGGSSLTAGGVVSPIPQTGDGLAIISFSPGSCPSQQSASGTRVTDRTAPVIGTFGLARSSFRAAPSGASTSAKRKARAPVGTKVSFTLSEASSVRFTVQRESVGRRVSGSCRPATHANRRKPRCTRWKGVAGSFTVVGRAGANHFTFRGRIGGKALKPGAYRLNGTATDPSKNASVPRRRNFRIVH